MYVLHEFSFQLHFGLVFYDIYTFLFLPLKFKKKISTFRVKIKLEIRVGFLYILKVPILLSDLCYASLLTLNFANFKSNLESTSSEKVLVKADHTSLPHVFRK